MPEFKLSLTVVVVILVFSLNLWTLEVNSRPSHSLKDDVPPKGVNISTKEIQGGKRTILRKPLTWVEADIECFEMFNTHLAILETPAEIKDLAKAIFDISDWNGTKPNYHNVSKEYEWGLERRYWIGLSDNWGNSSEYVWKTPDVPKINNSLAFVETSGWTANQPDHENPEKEKKLKANHVWEHCVGLWNPVYYRGDMHTMNDMPCLHKYYAICDNKPYQKR